MEEDEDVPGDKEEPEEEEELVDEPKDHPQCMTPNRKQESKIFTDISVKMVSHIELKTEKGNIFFIH